MKNIVVGLGHPAHYYLFKPLIELLENKGNTVNIVITDKDILEKLLLENNREYFKLGSKKTTDGVCSKAFKILSTTNILKKYIDKSKPDLMIGCISQMAYVSKLSGIPFLFFGEDDIDYTFLQCYITYPFVNNMVAPVPTNVGIFKNKKIAYRGYQKLAYLHPNRFTPNLDLIPEINVNEHYSIVRLVDLNAYHDINAKGINHTFLRMLIDKLLTVGKVYISSENKLPDEFNQYELPCKIQHMHHALAYANLFIGDSQSMTVEAAVLGVPALKFNDFKGKISVLNELEHGYGLTFGFNTSQSDLLLAKIDELIATKNLKEEFQVRRKKMLSDKIDVTAFFVWFVENYPASVKTLKETSDFQQRFKISY